MQQSEACNFQRHDALLRAGQLLDDAWSKQFIPLKVSVGAWLRLETALRPFPHVHGQVRVWAIDSILVAARRLAETTDKREPRMAPVVAIKLLARDAPDLSVTDLMRHYSCIRDSRSESSVDQQYLLHLRTSGLFGADGYLIAAQVEADIEAGESLRQKVWDYVSEHVAHALDEACRTDLPVDLVELNAFLDDVGALIAKWSLVVGYSGTSDDVDHIRPEMELVEALRMWDRERFDAAAREFAGANRLMNYRTALDWFRTHARAEVVVDEPEENR